MKTISTTLTSKESNQLLKKIDEFLENQIKEKRSKLKQMIDHTNWNEVDSKKLLLKLIEYQS
ncbi:hypothetical protein [uncultured Winogradskyella sp.]|uniref:hypothetical protein n=1 Tax=uncultured Winogradskyella sp. TaxID=395353 RepID=UPI002631ADE8|nr:hypothetical protein [uncultured Winogradskyella sp.]